MRTDAEGLDEIRRLSEAGKLKVPVQKTFPITEVREAHEAKDKRRIPGKVVLEVDWNEKNPTSSNRYPTTGTLNSTCLSVNGWLEGC